MRKGHRKQFFSIGGIVGYFAYVRVNGTSASRVCITMLLACVPPQFPEEFPQEGPGALRDKKAATEGKTAAIQVYKIEFACIATLNYPCTDTPTHTCSFAALSHAVYKCLGHLTR